MSRRLYRYRFQPHVPLEEVETSLVLSIWTCESLHGASTVLLEAGHSLDRERRSLVIEAETEAGQGLNKILCGFLTREFEPADFRVERIGDEPPAPAQDSYLGNGTG